MNKKLSLLVITFLSLFFLTACANQNTSKSGAQSSPPTMNAIAFTKEVAQYMDKQQALMVKQNEGQSGDFEALSQHFKEILNSSEYKEWENCSKRIENVKFSKSEKSIANLEKLQGALKECNAIQRDYFKKVAHVSTVEEYNKVSADMQKQLSASQDKFIDVMNHLN